MKNLNYDLRRRLIKCIAFFVGSVTSYKELEMDDEKAKLNEAELSHERQVEPGRCQGWSIITLLAFAIIIAGLCFSFASIIRAHHTPEVGDKGLERILMDMNETVAF